MYTFIQGPLVWISFMIFLGGIAFQVYRFLSYTRVRELAVLKPLPGSRKESSGEELPLTSRIQLTIAGTSPVTLFVTTVFHCLLFVIPLFLLAHNILWDYSLGISLFSFSEKATDYMTMVFLACGLYFLYRRIMVDRVRIITTPYDYVILFLATAPFFTGLMAYHGVFDYKTMVTLHILSGELMLIAVPFTKFVHMIFFFVFRFLAESEYSLGAGDRTW